MTLNAKTKIGEILHAIKQDYDNRRSKVYSNSIGNGFGDFRTLSHNKQDILLTGTILKVGPTVLQLVTQ